MQLDPTSDAGTRCPRSNLTQAKWQPALAPVLSQCTVLQLTATMTYSIATEGLVRQLVVDVGTGSGCT